MEVSAFGNQVTPPVHPKAILEYAVVGPALVVQDLVRDETTKELVRFKDIAAHSITIDAEGGVSVLRIDGVNCFYCPGEVASITPSDVKTLSDRALADIRKKKTDGYPT